LARRIIRKSIHNSELWTGSNLKLSIRAYK
jgi:hypothetical protein